MWKKKIVKRVLPILKLHVQDKLSYERDEYTIAINKNLQW